MRKNQKRIIKHNTKMLNIYVTVQNSAEIPADWGEEEIQSFVYNYVDMLKRNLKSGIRIEGSVKNINYNVKD